MNQAPSLPANLSAHCQIDSCATVSAHLSEFPTLAREKYVHGSYSLPTRFLRHADEQTVIGVRSLLKAMASDTQKNTDISNDAVIAATCLAGQPAAARTMIGLRDKGPVGVTLILFHSAHCTQSRQQQAWASECMVPTLVLVGEHTVSLRACCFRSL